jgi:hypothetical protein
LHEECGNSQIAAELNKKGWRSSSDRRFIPEILQRLRNHTYLVARLSAHRGEAPGGGSRYLAPKEGGQQGLFQRRRGTGLARE